MAEEGQEKGAKSKSMGRKCSACGHDIGEAAAACVHCGEPVNLPEEQTDAQPKAEGASAPPQDLVAKVTEGFEPGFVKYDVFGKETGGGYVVSPDGAIVALRASGTRVSVGAEGIFDVNGSPADKIFNIRLDEARADWQERQGKGETYQTYAARPAPQAPQAAEAEQAAGAEMPPQDLAAAQPEQTKGAGAGATLAPKLSRVRKAPTTLVSVTLGGETYQVPEERAEALKRQFGVLEEQLLQAQAGNSADQATDARYAARLAELHKTLKQYEALGAPEELVEKLGKAEQAPQQAAGAPAAPPKMRKIQRAPAPQPQTPEKYVAVILGGNEYYVPTEQAEALKSQFGVLERQVKKFAAALGQKPKRTVVGADDLLKNYSALGKTPEELAGILQRYSELEAQLAEAGVNTGTLNAKIAAMQAELSAAIVTRQGLEETIKDYDSKHPKALAAKDIEYQKRAEILARRVEEAQKMMEEARNTMKAGLETQRQRWEKRLAAGHEEYKKAEADYAATKTQLEAGLNSTREALQAYERAGLKAEEVNALRERHGTLQQQMEDLQAGFTKAKGILAAYQALGFGNTPDDVKAKVTGLEAKATGLEQQVSRLQEDLKTGAETQKTREEKRVTEMKIQYDQENAGLRERLAAYETAQPKTSAKEMRIRL